MKQAHCITDLNLYFAIYTSITFSKSQLSVFPFFLYPQQNPFFDLKTQIHIFNYTSSTTSIFLSDVPHFYSHHASFLGPTILQLLLSSRCTCPEVAAVYCPTKYFVGHRLLQLLRRKLRRTISVQFNSSELPTQFLMACDFPEDKTWRIWDIVCICCLLDGWSREIRTWEGIRYGQEL